MNSRVWLTLIEAEGFSDNPTLPTIDLKPKPHPLGNHGKPHNRKRQERPSDDATRLKPIKFFHALFWGFKTLRQ
jgi:hypothetical protein